MLAAAHSCPQAVMTTSVRGVPSLLAASSSAENERSGVSTAAGLRSTHLPYCGQHSCWPGAGRTVVTHSCSPSLLPFTLSLHPTYLLEHLQSLNHPPNHDMLLVTLRRWPKRNVKLGSVAVLACRWRRCTQGGQQSHNSSSNTGIRLQGAPFSDSRAGQGRPCRT